MIRGIERYHLCLTRDKYLSLLMASSIAVILGACSSGFVPPQAQRVGYASKEVQYIFNGDEFNSEALYTKKEQNGSRIGQTKPSVMGWGARRRQDANAQPSWSDDTLERELKQHQRALKVAALAQRDAARYDRAAKELQAAAASAQRSAGHGEHQSKASLIKAKRLQQRASEKARLARQARLRAERLQKLAQQEARHAQERRRQANSARIEAERIRKQAAANLDRAKRLKAQSLQEARLKAVKIKAREEALRTASALENKARVRTARLHSELERNRVEQARALKMARQAQARAEKLSQKFAVEKALLSRSRQHEMALKRNR